MFLLLLALFAKAYRYVYKVLLSAYMQIVYSNAVKGEKDNPTEVQNALSRPLPFPINPSSVLTPPPWYPVTAKANHITWSPFSSRLASALAEYGLLPKMGLSRRWAVAQDWRIATMALSPMRPTSIYT